MELIDKEITLRSFKNTDAKKLAELCNNKKIWDNLRDYIPFPYTENNAIEFNGELAGSIGLVKQTDVNKLTAETCTFY